MPNWEEIKEEWETSDISFKELAEKYDLKDSTIRSRKNREKWQRNAIQENATQQKNVATKKEPHRAPKGNRYAVGNRGNPNPKYKFPKHNTEALKHGFYSKNIPLETLEIMKSIMEDSELLDLLWEQIAIQYAAIIRAQQIMFVTDKTEMIKELKKAKYEYYPRSEEDGGGVEQAVTEEEYEFQFAWERHATFLNAQSRAMSELRGLIKQFDEMAHVEDERRLKLEGMRLNIDKTKAEINKLGSKEQQIRVIIEDDVYE